MLIEPYTPYSQVACSEVHRSPRAETTGENRRHAGMYIKVPRDRRDWVPMGIVTAAIPSDTIERQYGKSAFRVIKFLEGVPTLPDLIGLKVT